MHVAGCTPHGAKTPIRILAGYTNAKLEGDDRVHGVSPPAKRRKDGPMTRAQRRLFGKKNGGGGRMIV